MKTLRRIASTLLAVMMLTAMLVLPARAAGTYSITITGTDHEYKAYQIFSGTYNPLDGILTNVEWGDCLADSDILADLKADPTIGAIFAAASDAAGVATALEGRSGSVVDVFAKIVDANLDKSKNSGNGADSGDDYKISGLDAGYYIVIDQGEVGTDDGYSKHIIHVVGDVTVAPKVSVPTLEKTVSRDDISYVKAVSTSFSDTVYFQLDAQLHDRMGDFEKFYMEFTDTLPAGLTFVEGSIEVVIRNGSTETEVPAAGNYEVYASEDSPIVQIVFSDIKNTIATVTGVGAVAADHVIIKYRTKLDQDYAVIGGAGNDNTAILEYSANPNVTGDAYDENLGETSPSKAYVYTYQLVLHKVDGVDNHNLEGATFKLSRATASGFEYATVDAESRNITGWVLDKANGSDLTTDAAGLVKVNGLASTTTYYLEETAAPISYNLIEETMNVTINATADASGELQTLSATTAYGGTSVESVNMGAGSIQVKVPNVKGTVLPSTGGMGTTLFYVAGGAMMVSAAAILLAKKRFARG